MEEPLRVRLEFDDRKMISKSRRSDGLERCWFLLDPHIVTIADLAFHIQETFHLKRSCPNGVLLSMDNFALPPFESTCILKDKDIIRVRKKDAKRMGTVDVGNNRHCIGDSEAFVKQQIVPTGRLLMIRDCKEDSGHKRKDKGILCAVVENGSPSMKRDKRKHCDEIQVSKKKKLKTSSEKLVVIDQDEVTYKTDDENQFGHGLWSSHKRGCSNNKDEVSYGCGRPGSVIASQLEGDAVKVTSLQLERRKKKLKASSMKLHVTTNQDEVIGKGDGYLLEDNAGKVISPVQIEKGTEASILRRKKKLKTSSKKLNVTTDLDEVTDKEYKDNHVGRSLESSHKRGSSNKKGELSNGDGRPDSAIASELEVRAGKVASPVQIEKRNVRSEDNVVEHTCKQGPSRNALRKRARRKWLKTVLCQQNQSCETELKESVVHTKSPEPPVADLNMETEKEVVPVVVRPGHIRFQLLDEEQIQEHPQETVDSLQWNGITSKKKGQKWGREKTPSKWNNSNGYKEFSNDKAIYGETANTAVFNDFMEQSTGKRKVISEKGKALSNEINFESLFPLTRIPQVGDVLAYRLIELSSSWCPEVSPFRVGEVTSYNYISMSIILVPVPEYPIFSNTDEEGDDGMPQVDTSPYNEDGTLQIHYPSLLDVRLLKASDSEATTSSYPGQELRTEEATPANNCEIAATTSVTKETVAQPTENGSAHAVENGSANVVENRSVNVVENGIADVAENGGADAMSSWEEQIKQALNEKRKELQKKNGLDDTNPNQRTGSTSWSYRALRRSAIGPTLAYLRDQDAKQTHNGNYGEHA